MPAEPFAPARHFFNTAGKFLTYAVLKKNTTPSSSERDSNLNLPVLGGQAQYEPSALANSATEAEVLQVLYRCCGTTRLKPTTTTTKVRCMTYPIQADDVSVQRTTTDHVTTTKWSTRFELWATRLLFIPPLPLAWTLCSEYKLPGCGY
uniref:(California timema) hypothetical protein n=1 Tax=Timema californicum TaxID=61474 RepID=A0A7R9J682_TIMCA|nr:unnamed protein product [Timema californicum]